MLSLSVPSFVENVFTDSNAVHVPAYVRVCMRASLWACMRESVSTLSGIKIPEQDADMQPA